MYILALKRKQIVYAFDEFVYNRHVNNLNRTMHLFMSFMIHDDISPKGNYMIKYARGQKNFRLLVHEHTQFCFVVRNIV